MANNIVPTPQPSQPITEKGDNCSHVWWKWFTRLQIELVKYLPALGTANQLLGMNAAATATEFKTLTEGNGITIAHGVGSITITVKQMQLGDVLAFAARHG